MATDHCKHGIPRATLAKLTPHPYLLSNLYPEQQTPAGPLAQQPAPSIRGNGRTPRQARPPAVTYGSLTHPHGSAVVRVGDSTAICGVRAETLLVADIPNYRRRKIYDGAGADADADAAELRDYELLVPNIELATGSAPQFLPGGPPTQLAQTLSTRVYSLLHSSRLVNVGDLRIWREVEGAEEDDKVEDDQMEDDKEEVNDKEEDDGEGDGEERNEEEGDEDEDDQMETDDNNEEPAELTKRKEVVAYWVLYIDIFFISFDGSGFDVAWAALLAALRDTSLPSAYWDMDREMILCRRREPFRPLTINGLPISCTAAVFVESGENSQRGGDDGEKFWVLVDPDADEEKLCAETATVVVDRSATSGAEEETRILAVEKSGGARLDEDMLTELMGVAEARWAEWKVVLQA